MAARIISCRLCGKVFKRMLVEWRVYPPDYDYSCCAECNAKYTLGGQWRKET